MISSISLSDSFVLLKCYLLALNEKDSGNFTLGRLLSDFPPYIYKNYVDLIYYEREISNMTGPFIVREEKTSSGSSKS